MNRRPGIRRHPVRFLFRVARLGVFVVVAFLTWVFGIWLAGRRGDRRARAAWQQRRGLAMLRIFHCQVEVRGELPATGIIASNHLGYFDILVLASLQPTVFLSKAEVARWPVFGAIARGAGTLFIRREQRSHVAAVAQQLAPVIEAGVPLVMFLEGTSTGGEHVLPFRPSLLEPVVANHWPATPAWIGYTLEGGSVAGEIAYWGDMTLVPHLMNLLTKDRVVAHVAFGEPQRAEGADRKELARRLQLAVCQQAGKFGRHVVIGSHWHELKTSAP